MIHEKKTKQIASDHSIIFQNLNLNPEKAIRNNLDMLEANLSHIGNLAGDQRKKEALFFYKIFQKVFFFFFFPDFIDFSNNIFYLVLSDKFLSKHLSRNQFNKF